MPSSSEDFHIWEGIYSSFVEAGGSTRVFHEPLWVERCTEKALRLLEQARGSGFTPVTGATHEYCLPVIAATLQARRSPLRILDFGGSVGFSVPSVVSALGDPAAVEIHIVDNEKICEAGRKVFAGDPRVTFQTSPPAGVRFDLVHCGSSIQYVEDWPALVRELVSTEPELLVFDDLPAGEVPTFVSLQAYYGKKIPHWFFDVREFARTVTAVTGYRLCYRSRYVGTFLGKTGPFPMENFPEDHRIENAYNLAFARPSR
jgi:putative methyltransferase (TIGR04325 family)